MYYYTLILDASRQVFGRVLTQGNDSDSIPHMRVPHWPVRIAGSCGYFTGSWRDASPYLDVILITT